MKSSQQRHLLRNSLFGRVKSEGEVSTQPHDKSRKNSAPTKSITHSADADTTTLLYEPHEESVIFSVYMNVSVKNVKLGDRPILSVNEGELVSVFYQKMAAPNLVYATARGEKGYMMLGALGIDNHTKNIYLEAMDIFISNPMLLVKIFNETYADFPHHEKKIIKLLSARRILPRVLKELMTKECDSNHDPNELFRDESPAIQIVCKIIGKPCNVNEAATHNPADAFQLYRDQLRNYLLKSCKEGMRIYAKDAARQPEIIADTLKKILSYLTQSIENGIPYELVCIMQALKKAVPNYVSAASISPLLGSMFFLRFINPELIKMSTDGASPLFKEAAKELQRISNQVSSSDHALAPTVSKLLDQILNSHPTTSPDVLMMDAAHFYRFLTTHFPEIAEVKTLREKLGEIPHENIISESHLPRIQEIKTIEKYIEEISASTSAIRNRAIQ